MWLNNIPINGKLLKSKALSFAQKIGIDETAFKASDGWLQKYKNMVFHSKSFVEKETVDKWKDGKLKSFLEKYVPDNICNADERCLVFMLKPNRSFFFKYEIISGGRATKQRLTFLLCSNKSGTEKFPLLAFGKSKKPRCFNASRPYQLCTKVILNHA